MKAQKFLQQEKLLSERIDSDFEELAQLDSLSTSIKTQLLSGMPSSKNKNTEPQFVECIEKIDTLKKDIMAEIDILVGLKKEIRDVINTAPTNEEILVLKYKYIQRLKWAAIASKLDLSLEQVYRIHKTALKNIKLPYNDSK